MIGKTLMNVNIDHYSDNGDTSMNLSSTIDDKETIMQIMKLAGIPIPEIIGIPMTLIDDDQEEAPCHCSELVAEANTLAPSIINYLHMVGKTMVDFASKSHNLTTSSPNSLGDKELNDFSRVGEILVGLGEPYSFTIKDLSEDDIMFIIKKTHIDADKFKKMIGLNETTRMISLNSKYDMAPLSKKQAMMTQKLVNNTGDNPIKSFKHFVDSLGEGVEDADHGYIIDTVIKNFDVGDFLKELGDQLMWDNEGKTIISQDFDNYSDSSVVELVRQYLNDKTNHFNPHTKDVMVDDSIINHVYYMVIKPFLTIHGYTLGDESPDKKNITVGE